MITADHGNAEKMLDHGKPWTAHTLNKVNFILVANDVSEIKLKKDGVLGDIAPTILEIMGIKKPEEMERTSLLLPGK